MHCYKASCVFKSLNDIKNKNITIMGLGLNGGGEATARFFLKYGANVLVTDMKSKDVLLPTITKLDEYASSIGAKDRLCYVLGEHREKDFSEADCVIKNPGVKIEGNRFLALAKDIESDISIFLRFTKATIIAVTGSKGKSSTVSAIYYGLKKAGLKSFLGGNITVSPLTFLEETSEDSYVVLELSSWQLADLRGRKALKPYISVITKIVPDHQNWYGNMESYVNDKKLIYADQGKNDFTIVDFDDEWGKIFASETKADVLFYSRNAQSGDFKGVYQKSGENSEISGFVKLSSEKEDCIMKELSVPGEHMKTNVLNAALVLYLLGVSSEKIIDICKSYPGLEHRLQYFHSYKNNKFYNDSCSTVPEAVLMAMKAFEKKVILITGGTDKGLSFDCLQNALCDKNNPKLPEKLFLLSGTGTDKYLNHLESNKISFEGPFDSLQELLEELKKYIDENNIEDKVVVFSPGATSFGMFLNEFDRGNIFMNTVSSLF